MKWRAILPDERKHGQYQNRAHFVALSAREVDTAIAGVDIPLRTLPIRYGWN